MTTLPIAETFTAVQGEGIYTGTPMTFFRTVGCTVSKKICHHCDTDFDTSYPWLGGGLYTPENLYARTHADHVCFTGGEPLNHDLRPFLRGVQHYHIETSGTVHPSWWGHKPDSIGAPRLYNFPRITDPSDSFTQWVWLTCSPKPGFLEPFVLLADEIKVIVGGLGNGPGWPSLDDALRWADAGKTVFLQPRNDKNTVNPRNLSLALELVEKNPSLRLSVQLHKFINVR